MTDTQDDPDDRHPGRELAVDDVIAVDRLGEQSRQRPLGSLAVDGVEGEGDPEQRRHHPDECVDPEDVEIGVGRAKAEQRQEDRRRPARLRGEFADAIGGDV